MGQGSQALGDRPKTVEPQGIDRQATERGQDPNAIALVIGMGVLLNLRVAGPPAALHPPAFRGSRLSKLVT